MKKNLFKGICMIIIMLSFMVYTPLLQASECTSVAVLAASDYYVYRKAVTMTTGETFTQKLKNEKGKTVKAARVKWKSSDSKVAKISKSGKITAVKKGTAKMTATYKNKKYSFKVTVKNASLNYTKKTLTEKKSVTLSLKNASGKKISAGKIKWSSSDEAVARVSSKGKVTALKKGSAKIYAEYKGKKYNCSLKVTAIKASLSLSSSDIVLYGNAEKKLTVTASPSAATVRWASADTEVAEVSVDGVVTAKKEGSTYITASLYYNGEVRKMQKCKVAVKAFSLDAEEKSIELYIGQTYSLEYTLAPKSASTEWESSNFEIVTVDRRGQIGAMKEGSAKITLTATIDGQKKSVIYYIKVCTPSISLDKGSVEAYINEDFVINVTAEPSDSRVYTTVEPEFQFTQRSKSTSKEGKSLVETFTYCADEISSGTITFYFYYMGDIYSAKCKINVKSRPLTYNYSCVLLDDMYYGQYYAENSFYGTGSTVLYVKTDNPDPEAFDVTDTKTETSVVMSLQFDPGHRIAENNNSVFFDVMRREGKESVKWMPVEGGYIGITSSNVIPAGKRNFCVVEDTGDGKRRYGADFETVVLDYETEFNKWCDNLIAEVANEGDNVHEKMSDICDYLLRNAKYLPNKDGSIRLLAEAIGPSFKTLYVSSYISPAMLVRIGERMGYELENLYFGDDWSLHYYVKGCYSAEEHLYHFCPLSYTGEIGSLDYEMIDFSKY